jgi:hypothetical protein
MVKSVLVLDVNSLVSRSTSKKYRAECLAASTRLVRFLEDNKLLKRKILNVRGELSQNEKIFDSDLTPEGLALEWGLFIDKWFARQDRNVPIENIKTLENGLKKIRKMGAHEFLKTTRYFLYYDTLH